MMEQSTELKPSVTNGLTLFLSRLLWIEALILLSAVIWLSITRSEGLMEFLMGDFSNVLNSACGLTVFTWFVTLPPPGKGRHVGAVPIGIILASYLISAW